MQSGPMKQPVFTFTTLALLVLLGVSVPLVLGFFNGLHPAFDSLSQFRSHFAALMALPALALLFTTFRLQGVAGLALALAAFSTTVNLPVLLGLEASASQFPSKDKKQASYRLLQMNLRFDNATPESALSLIGQIQPDVITLQEVSDMWKGKLAALSATYRYSIICPYPNGVFGVAILSRVGLEQVRNGFIDGLDAGG